MTTERFEIVITSRGAGKTSKGIDRIGKSAGGAKKALAFMRAALVLVASVRILKGFLDLADSLTLIRNRLRLVTASTAELISVQNALFKISRETRTSFEDNVELFSRMTRATLTLKLSFKKLLAATKTVALAIKISSPTTQEATSAIIQFGQGLAAGALQGQELRSVAEQLPRLARIIGKEFKAGEGKLIAFGKANEGAITTVRILKSLRAAVSELNDEFNKVVPTMADGFVAIRSAAVLFFGTLVNATGVGQILANLLLDIADNLDKVFLGFLAFASLLVFNLIVSQLLLLNSTVVLVGRAILLFGGGFLRVFKVLLAPITLLRTAFVFVGLAAKSALLSIVGVGRIAVKTMFALLTPVRSLGKLFGLLRVAVITNPLFLIGAAVVFALVAVFVLFKDKIRGVIDALGGMREIFDDVVTFGIAAVQTIIQAWRQFPSAIADLAIQAVNFLVSSFESAVNAVSSLINSLITKINEVNQAATLGGRFFNIPAIPLIPQADLGRIENQFQGVADNIATIFKTNFDKIKEEGGGIEVVTDTFNELLATFKEFTGGLLEIDPEILKNLPTLSGDAEEAAQKLEQLKRASQSLIGSISPLASATFSLARAIKALNDAEEKGIDIGAKFGLTQAEVLRRVERAIIGVGNATTDFADKQKLLRSALDRNVISSREFETEIRNTRIAMLDQRTDAAAGVERTFLKIQAAVSDAAANISEILTTTFRGAEDAFVDFVQTGKLSIRELVQDISSQFLRLGFRSLIGGLGASLGFGSITKGGGLFGGGLPGMASGGSFTVSPATSLSSIPGIDNRLVAFRARDNETVTVTSPGQSAAVAAGGRSDGNTIVFNITTPNADSFRRSQTQLENRAQGALDRSRRRR